MLKILKSGLYASVPLIFGGCTTVANTENMPAVIVAPSAEAHAELEAIVSKAMNGAPVTLAAGSLTAKNTLIVERKQHRTISNDPLMGRNMERPDHFALHKTGGKCILTHEETGEVYELKSAECVPTDSVKN
jgi:hypothetical protein